ncbi:MAG: LON peptidase substrate-binding domain-containing protein [Lautropia sp.]
MSATPGDPPARSPEIASALAPVGVAAYQRLAIFPLATVLFPGGVLPLRIFEARYMDMVRECMKHDRPFGVCRITHGNEAGSPAEHEPVGCLATISHWDMEQLGLLHIRTVGTRRFRIMDESLGENGLLRADVDLIDDDAVQPIPDDLAPCVDIVRKLVERIVEDQPDECKRAVASPFGFDSASWVGNRLCEFLPLDGALKQALMQLDDPLERLRQVRGILRERKIV